MIDKCHIVLDGVFKDMLTSDNRKSTARKKRYLTYKTRQKENMYITMKRLM